MASPCSRIWLGCAVILLGATCISRRSSRTEIEQPALRVFVAGLFLGATCLPTSLSHTKYTTPDSIALDHASQRSVCSARRQASQSQNLRRLRLWQLVLLAHAGRLTQMSRRPHLRSVLNPISS